MSKLFGILAIVIIIAVGFLALKPIDFYSTLTGMRAAVSGDPGTAVWGNGNLLVLSWQQGQNNAFVVVNSAGEVVKDLKSFCNGNGCDWQSFAQFGKWLEQHGYQSLAPEAIPATIVMTLKSYSLLLVAVGSKALPSIWLVPLTVSDFNRLPTQDLQ